MLCFGNFRFPFRWLNRRYETKLEDELSPHCKETSAIETELRSRPPKMLEIDSIARDATWCLGEISGKKVTKEAKVLEKELRKAEEGKSRFTKSELLRFRDKLLRIRKEIERAQEQARVNTDIYLTWDYMDIYVATSMRNKWEYEETFDFVQNVFSAEKLRELGLRYFDPTQSMCANARDKGLIEGLMLKRAFCAIYLAQESDTMGKDSELAATLAQGKPVIAYVPKHEYQEYAKKISKYPLDFFKKRLLILNAEEVFQEPECMKQLMKADKKYEKIIEDFLRQVDNYRDEQPFYLWMEKDENFKKNCKDFPKICEILAIAECYNFEKRAKLLNGRHPLCMQVNLESGVANGVLVVRSPKECAELLYRILTNQTKFSIEREEKRFTILKEYISESAFRVVTDYERLTNSFWNLFRST